ncbi:MAG: hypothetical protein U9N52_04800 [Campylobacterota bacterium]|nr:hypothetical protein [Campylobacterota bacterium]
MKDFKWKTGKNKGAINIAELAKHAGIAEGTLRARSTRRPKEFELFYMGIVCKANNIDINDLTYMFNKLKK